MEFSIADGRLENCASTGCWLHTCFETREQTVLKLAEMINKINELSKGVVNIVTGDGLIAGTTLVQSADIGKIAFTGSSEVGGKFVLVYLANHYYSAPWDGFKQSGIGRELGTEGIRNYFQSKQVYINLQ